MGATHIDVKMLVIFFICLVIRLGVGEEYVRLTNFPDSQYVWKPYPREMYPHFKRAYLDLASSYSKIAIFFHSLNLNVTDGVYHDAEPDYSFTTDGSFDFYYNWAARPAEESVDTTVTDQYDDESDKKFAEEWFEYIVTDEPADRSADEFLHTTVTDQSADEFLHTTVTDQSADEFLHTTVTDQSADEFLHTTVTDQSADEFLHTTVTDQSADEFLHTTVTDQSADEFLHTTVTDQSADEFLHTTVTDQSADEFLHTTVTDQSADEFLHTTVTDQSADEFLHTTVTDQSADEFLHTTVTDQSADEFLHTTVTDQFADESLNTTVSDPSDYNEQDFSNMIEDRLGLLVEELQEQISETVEKPPLQAGSIRGIPGVHFPDYYEIPITSFTCADKKYIPGFYADLETGCQVFHVCWPHRRESFLCPVGTTFNQAILSCDYWYSTNCSLAPLFFDVNARVPDTETSTAYTSTMIDDLIKSTRSEKAVTSHSVVSVSTIAKPVVHTSEQTSPDANGLPDIDWSRILKFLPVKSKVVIFPESTGSKLTIKHTSLKPHEQESEKVKLDSKVKFATRIIDGILKAAVDAQRSIPEIESAAELLSPKAAKVPQVKPVEKQIPLPTINTRFVVQPLLAIKTTEEDKRKLAALSAAKSTVRVPSTPMQPAKVLIPKTSLKMKNENIPDIVIRALEAAGSVLQRDILPYTRKVLVDSSVNVHKAKKM